MTLTTRAALRATLTPARLRARRSGTVVWIVLGLLAMAAALASAAGPDQADADSAPEPDEVLRTLHERYSQAPFAERVTLEVLDEQGRVRTAWYLLRVDPAGDRPSFRLDLGELAVHAEADNTATKLTAVHSVDQGRYARTRASSPIGPAALEGFVPPVVVPSLWLAFADDPLADVRWTPFTGRVEWQDVVLETADGEQPDEPSAHPARLLGRADRYTLEATIDLESGRLLGLLVRDREGGPRVRLLAESIDEGDSAEWAIDVSGRDAVDDVRRLRRTHRPLAVGDAFPLRSFLDPQAGLWSLDEAIESETRRGRAETVVILAFYATSDGGADERSAARRRAGRALMEAGAIARRLNIELRDGAEGRRAPMIRLIPQAVGVFEINAFSSESLHDEVAFWAEQGNAAATPGFVWTISREESLDRLVRGSDAALAVVDARGELVDVISLLGPDAGPDHLETDLERAIRRAAWPLFTPGAESGGG